MDIEEAVGAELRACRRKKQVSQEQLGFDAGIHRTYVSLIERGVGSGIVTICAGRGLTPYERGWHSAI
jgi:transcriptional regulator with XRE-family HTH domain